MNQPRPIRQNVPPPRPVSDGGKTVAPAPRPGGVRPSNKAAPKVHSSSQQAALRPAVRAPGQKASSPIKRPSGPLPPEQEVERKAQRPQSMDELIPALVRYAIRQSQGLGISEFDEKLLPRMKELLPAALKSAADDAILDHLLALAHALFVALVCGQFKDRPVLCNVRACELAADLVERVLARAAEREEERLTAIRCKNLLVGLTFSAVRLLECTNLEHESLKGFTDNYERAVIIAYGLKTQAEATGVAPWSGMKDNPLDKRIGATINTMSEVFGDYIAKHSQDLSAEVNESVLAEFDGFMERFAPYIDTGSTSASGRTRPVVKPQASDKPSGKIEPLEIKELRTRPAGVEIRLADGRVLFVSRDDAQRIGKAADGEVEDTERRKRQELEARSEPADDAANRGVDKGPSRKHAREAIEQRQAIKAPLPRPRAR